MKIEDIISKNHTEEVQDIIGRSPSQIILYGNVILFSIFTVLLILASIINYPDFITAPVTLSISPPPLKMVAISNGRIKELFVKNQDTVKRNQIVAVMDNTAATNDMIVLQEFIKKLDSAIVLKEGIINLNFPHNLEVGSIQPSLLELEEAFNIFKIKRVKLRHFTDSNHRRKVIENSLLPIRELLQKVKFQISVWQNQFVISAPIPGKLMFFKFWTADQYLNKGEEIFFVIPRKQKYTVVVKLPVSKAGKVKKGQQVVIKLNELPFEEFGVLNGTVQDITEAPLGNYLYVNIILNNSLNKGLNNKIQQIPIITGSAEIVTNNSSILARILPKT